MNQTNRPEIEQFFNQLKNSEQTRQLLEHIPDIFYFVKDRKSRLITCNQAMLSFYGVRHVNDIYGKTGKDFFPENIAGPYLADDERVMSSGQPLIDGIELALKEDGILSWFCTTKMPLYNQNNEVIGLMGITRWMSEADQSLHPAARILPAVNYIKHHFREDLTIPHLSKLCRISVSQLHRNFKEHFRQTPLQFILKLRIQAACKLLRSTSLSIREISQECGFPDQNYFARHFKLVTNINPTEFRKQFKLKS